LEVMRASFDELKGQVILHRYWLSLDRRNVPFGQVPSKVLVVGLESALVLTFSEIDCVPG